MRSRKNQYDIKPSATTLNEKQVAVILDYDEPSLPSISCIQTDYSYYINDHFFSMNDVNIHTTLPKQISIDDEQMLDIKFSNYEHYRLAMKNRDVKLCVLIQDEKNQEVSYLQKPLTEAVLLSGTK